MSPQKLRQILSLMTLLPERSRRQVSVVSGIPGSASTALRIFIAELLW